MPTSSWLAEKNLKKKPKKKFQVRSFSDKKGDNYDERLKNAGLTTLEDRRRRGDQIQTFKAIKGFSRVEPDEWFSLKDPTITRPTRANTVVTELGETMKAHVMNMPVCRLDVRKNFYNVRIVKEWNSLPENAKNAKSINEFKNLYDEKEKGNDQFNS